MATRFLCRCSTRPLGIANMKLLTVILCAGMAILMFGCSTSDQRAWLEAHQHLAPEPGLLAEFDSYDHKIRTVLSEGYGRDVLFRMICIPSFEPEWMVGIEKDDNNTCSVFVLRPNKHIWKSELIPMYESGQITEIVQTADGSIESRKATNDLERLKREMPSDFRNIGVEKQSAGIDAGTADLLAEAWSQMILKARHPEEDVIGLDGVTYHFSMWIQGRGIVSGKIWCPEQNTNTGLLTSIGHSLMTYVTADKDKRVMLLNEIRATASKLNKRLK